MTAILNIGLKIDALGDEHNTQQAITARSLVVVGYLRSQGYRIVSYSIKDSHTEQTLVIELTELCGYTNIDCRFIARALCQDCIAIYYPEMDGGLLIGDNADKWGQFNKEYFLMP